MADALLVFSPLQEICFFVLRTPYLDQIGVAPLLRRRLFGLQSFFDFVGFPKYVSSPRHLLLRFVAFAFRQLLHRSQVSLPFAFWLTHQFLFKLPTLRRSVPTV